MLKKVLKGKIILPVCKICVSLHSFKKGGNADY